LWEKGVIEMGHTVMENVERERDLFVPASSGLGAVWQRIRELFTSPLLYSEYALGFDGSHWTEVDWDILAANVDFVIWKCSEGTGFEDTTFAPACQAAYDCDIPFAAYHYFRIDSYLGLPFPSNDEIIDKYWPRPAADQQLQNMIHSLANKAVNGLYIDIEATRELDSGNVINALWASKAAKIFVGRAWDWWKTAHPNKPFGIYTSNGYISSYAPDMANWAGGYDNWVAQWAVYPANTTTITWAQAKASYMPADTARPKPFGTGTCYLWQYTGDRLVLPGIYTTDGRHLPRTCDLNLFMGSKAAMRAYFAYTPHDTVPIPPPPDTPPPPPPPPPDNSDLAQITTRMDKMQTTLDKIAGELENIRNGLIF
jgi:hypothetical protein